MMQATLLPLHTQRMGIIVLLLIATVGGNISAASAASSAGTYAEWAWPVASPHPVIRPYIAPATKYSAGHRGIDIRSPIGSIVRSPADGVIHFSGFVVNRSIVSIDHGAGTLSSFEPVLSDLIEGTLVHRGDPIGTLQPGHCTATCLHLGARVHGHYVSPMNFLGDIPRSVLLPTRAIP